MSHVYVEQGLQLAAIAWLKEHRGYVEMLSDDMAVGDRVDSVGIMAGRVLLVEVKPAVGAGMVRHASDRRGSLESKVAGVLRAVHSGELDRVSRAVHTTWDRACPPVVAVLAARYPGDGLERLRTLLEERASDWLFDFRIWQWDGSRVVELARQDLIPPPCPRAYDRLQIPKLIAHVRRARALSVEELSALARERGVGELLASALNMAAGLGFRRTTTCGNINLRRPTPDGRWETVVGFYITGSSSGLGLNVGFWREGLALEDGDLPGQQAPRMGFLNTNRYIRTEAEIAHLIHLFRPALAEPVLSPGSSGSCKS